MTLSEFKAWFEGFSELMEGAPNEKQWKRIQERVAEIDGTAVTKTVFVDRYIERLRPYWGHNLYCGAIGAGQSVGTTFTANSASAMKSAGQAVGAGASFNSHSAMLDLGRAEFSSAAA